MGHTTVSAYFHSRCPSRTQRMLAVWTYLQKIARDGSDIKTMISHMYCERGHKVRCGWELVAKCRRPGWLALFIALFTSMYGEYMPYWNYFICALVITLCKNSKQIKPIESYCSTSDLPFVVMELWFMFSVVSDFYGHCIVSEQLLLLADKCQCSGWFWDVFWLHCRILDVRLTVVLSCMSVNRSNCVRSFEKS